MCYPVMFGIENYIYIWSIQFRSDWNFIVNLLFFFPMLYKIYYYFQTFYDLTRKRSLTISYNKESYNSILSKITIIELTKVTLGTNAFL